VAIGEKGKPVINLFEAWTQAMFKVIEYAVSFAPIGVFGFVAFSVAKYGVQSLMSLGQFVLVAYLAFAIVALVLMPIIIQHRDGIGSRSDRSLDLENPRIAILTPAGTVPRSKIIHLQFLLTYLPQQIACETWIAFHMLFLF